MSKYQSYTAYASLWNKSFPSHWSVLPMYALAKEKSICGCVDLPLLSVYLDVGVIPFSAKAEKRTNVTSKDLSKYQRVDCGDFVLNNQQAWRGSVGISFDTGIVSPAYIVLSMNNMLNSRYANYLLRSRIMVDQYLINSKSVGSIQRNIYWPALKRTSVPVPPREEQDQIVRFLDWKVSGINRLIGVRKKQVAEYEVLRKRIILSSVTHGLNKAAPVEMCEEQWIAEMPTHWSLLPIKRLFEIFSGATPQSGNSEYWNGDIVWITPADFKTKDHYIYQGTKNLTDSGFSACSTSMIPPDSIVFSKRAPVGTVAINKVDLCTNQGCLSCVPVEGVSSEFFYYAMSVCTEEFERRAAGTTFKEISLTAFGSFLMPVPPTDEQLEIVKYLEKTCGDIDLAIQNIQSQIEALNELKFRIIADTVTGKIDVRGIEIPEYEFVEEMVDDDNSDCGEEAEEQED